MTYTPAVEERAAGRQAPAGAPMQASAHRPDVPNAPSRQAAGAFSFAQANQEEVDMFEAQPQAEVEAMMKTSTEFKQLYQRHKELDKKVLDAELGVLPVDDMTLMRMKREKLAAKDRLTRMFEGSH
jgi:uncharacterized protein YdcH (DUF465 family)